MLMMNWHLIAGESLVVAVITWCIIILMECFSGCWVRERICNDKSFNFAVISMTMKVSHDSEHTFLVMLKVLLVLLIKS